MRGGFNWGLNFKWDAIPREELQKDSDYTGPFNSPTMAGGLFAINRSHNDKPTALEQLKELMEDTRASTISNTRHGLWHNIKVGHSLDPSLEFNYRYLYHTST